MRFCYLILCLFSFEMGFAQCNAAAMLNEGKQKLQGRNYKEAINNFIAARYCEGQPDLVELNRLIVQAQTAWDSELKTLREQYNKAKNEAEQSRQNLDEQREKTRVYASRADEYARNAQDYAEMAQRLGKMAEGLRLSLLSETSRSQGRRSEALALAYLSRQLLGLEDPEAERVFGAAARDSFSRTLRSFPAGLNAFRLLPNDGMLALLPSGSAELFSLQNNSSRALNPEARDSIRQIIYAPDGKTMLSYSENLHASLWSLSGDLIARLSGHTEGWLSAAYSPDGQTIISCSRDNTARLWSARDGRLLHTLSGHQGNVYEGRFSPDGEKALSRSSDGTVRVWDVGSGAPIGLIEPRGLYTHAAQFNPSGEAVLTAGADGSLKIWTPQGAAQKEMREHQGVVKTLAFSPNGASVVSFGVEQEARLWNARGELTAPLQGHRGGITCAAFSPQSDLLATAAADQQIKIWDLQGHLRLSLEGHQAPVNNLVFSPDGALLLSSANDGTARLWNRQGQLLMELDLGQSRIPAVFSANGREIYHVQGNALRACPTPAAAYAALEARKVEFERMLNGVRRDFRVQH
jgi:WD40 repeat protein